MEIHHKIKPLHGWREFVGEVGIIVFGVLIALGAEQAVEWVHWRQQVEETYDALGGELGDDLAAILARVRTYECTEHRLDEIGGIVAAAERSGRLPPIGSIGYAVSSKMSDGVWQGALASGVNAHVPRQDRIWLSKAYGSIDELRAANIAELDIWSELYQISGPGGPISADTAQHLRELLSRARFYNTKIANYGTGLLEDRSTAPFPIEQKEIEFVASRPLSVFTPCRPIPTQIAKVYGQAPWQEYYRNGMIERFRERRARAGKH